MDIDKVLGTAQVPRDLWSAAGLIGSTPFRACSFDQRASYCMYIPESHYRVDASPKLRLVVHIHGNMRRAERCRDSLIDFADQSGAAILSPLFPGGIEDVNDSQNYKFLRYKDIRYDMILLSMIDEVAKRWPGIDTDKFLLAGFSGGGQFVSRFYYLHPHRLLGVSIGAPGVVTSLDRTIDWPKGIKDAEKHFDGLSVDVNSLKSVPHVQLVVGEKDTEPPGGGLLQWYTARMNGHSNMYASLGKSLPDRIQAMASLRDELIAAGVQLRYDVVTGAGHESSKVLPVMIEFLREALTIH